MRLPRTPAIVSAATAIWLLLPSGTACAADLQPRTVAAFDRYVAATERRTSRPDPVLWVDELPESEKRQSLAEIRRGDVFIQRLTTRDNGRGIDVPDGLIHHWLGTVFVPGHTTDEAVRLLRDYNRHAEIFAPAVQRSRILSEDGDRVSVFLRFRQQKVITVIVDSDHDALFTRWSPDHVSSRIVSTRIAEIENAGQADERAKPIGHDGGYLWRLNTYWRFLARDDGVYVQCESVTLTRGIPLGFGWLIRPFVTGIPRETLTFTLETVRAALLKG